MKNYHRFRQFISPSFAFQTMVIVGLLIGFLLFAGVSQTIAAPGDLDPTFGSGGIVVNPTEGTAMTLQTDGKIIVVGRPFLGQFTDFGVVRYNPNGTLDSTFGTGGRVNVPVGNFSDYAQAVVVQPNGKIVVAGYAATNSGATNYNFAVVRLNADGSLDTTFDGDGKVTTVVGGSGSSSAYAVALQSDGKIVLAGSRGGFAADFALVRYNPDGSLDASFDVDGQVVTPVGDNFDAARSIAVQTDGKIVATGEAGVGTTFELGIVRYNTDGSLDASFGTGGKVVHSFGVNNDIVSALALQSDGKIVVAGASQNSGSRYDFAAARVNPNGTLDASFGSNGITITPVRYSSIAYAVAIQRNGKIIVAGRSDPAQFAGWNFAVARYNPNGTLDAGFGENGVVITQASASQETARAVAVQPDGKIVVAGELANNHAVIRYLGDAPSSRPAFDFDGDGKTDYGVFRPSNGTWYLLNSNSGFSAAQFGVSTDRLVPADYDGDGKTDIAVYRAGVWYLQRSALGFTGVAFGTGDDVPVPADFDGDGKAELAVFRPSNGTWYMYNLAAGQTSAVQFGASGDKPIPADYDGDGKADVAVFRPSNGTWYLNRTQAGFTGVQFGISTDKPVAADYDGDGKADIAVARQSGGLTAWYILGSTLGFYGMQFGTDTDTPVAGDYDGDGKTDIAVWRASNGVFYFQRSSGNQFSAAQFGTSGDSPLAAAFVP